MDYDSILATAVTIATEAGQLLRAGFRQKKQIQKKSADIDWLTQYDTAAETLIVGRLREAYPEHGIVSEEGNDHVSRSGLSWYIDPLDGTNNFAHGFPVFCVSLALYRGDEALLGVVYDPLRAEHFTAIAGTGAYLLQDGSRERLNVSGESELRASLLATGFPYDRQTAAEDNTAQTRAFLRRAHGIRRTGSAALDIAYVAAGRLDGYWEFKLFSWDMAAASLLVREAGGQVTGMDGLPLRMTRQLSMVVSNGHIHERMLAVLAEVGQAA